MLSLRRQVPPGLCHRATPSLPRTLPSSRALLRCDPVATTLPISRPSGLFPSDFHACSACVGSDHQGLDSAKLRRLRRGGHRPHATPRLASRLPAAPAAAQRVLARPTRDTERTARLGPRLSIVAAVPQRHSRRPQATATSRPATLASARCVLARPVRDTERTAHLGSRLRRAAAAVSQAARCSPSHLTIVSCSCCGPACADAARLGRRAHCYFDSRHSVAAAASRRTQTARCSPSFSRLPTAVAAARRVPARPVRDTERATPLDSPLSRAAAAASWRTQATRCSAPRLTNSPPTLPLPSAPPLTHFTALG